MLVSVMIPNILCDYTSGASIALGMREPLVSSVIAACVQSPVGTRRKQWVLLRRCLNELVLMQPNVARFSREGAARAGHGVSVP
jgi:hypothetical protein